MKILFQQAEFSPDGFDLVVVPRFEAGEGTKGKGLSAFPGVPAPLAKALARRIADSDFSGKAQQRCALDVDNGAYRIVFLGLGKRSGDAVTPALRRIGASVWGEATSMGARSVAVVFESGGAPVSSNESSALLEAFLGASYRFSRYQSSPEKKGLEPNQITFFGLSPLPSKEVTAIQSLVRAVASARDLVNTPPNDCNPQHLADFCRNLAKGGSLKCQVRDRTALEKMGAHALLAVAKGSDQPSFLITLSTPKPRPKAPVIALVGKGVTFDSGGLSIKPADSMMEMKADMSGAAAVIGAMEALASKKLPVELRAYIPTVENMINGKATRPGDVVTSLSGQTVEILNTDAEGRLILCDAITLAEREGADIIIDVATLTGACIVALGTRYAGLFSDDEALCEAILAAAQQSGEPFWRLPLATEYDDLLKSSIADMKNIGNRWGGAITAALFLKRFVKKARWAHLDIAGPAFDETGGGSTPKGGAGFAVRTLVRAVEALANSTTPSRGR